MLGTVRTRVFSLVLLVAAFGALSVWLGPDASWDLRNYHLYDAHAALAGTLWTDIAPAQLQSYYNPALDIAFYVLRRALNAHPALLDFLLAAPHAVAVWLVLGIAADLLRPGRLMPAVAVLLGATGAAALPTLGTSMSAMPEACLLLLALRFCVTPPCRHARESGHPWCGVTMGSRFRGNDEGGWLGGLLAGAAVGLKLTIALYAIGLGAALLVARPRALPAFAAAAAGALLIVAGPWWWIVWQHTGNPLFPYFNELFRSSWAPAIPFTDTRFLPRGVLQTALFPALWAFHRSTASNELPVRDPRLLLGLLASLWLVATRRDKRERALGAFWIVAFAAWEARFGILRYAGVLELLSGIPVALAVSRHARARPTAVRFRFKGAACLSPSWPGLARRSTTLFGRGKVVDGRPEPVLGPAFGRTRGPTMTRGVLRKYPTVFGTGQQWARPGHPRFSLRAARTWTAMTGIMVTLTAFIMSTTIYPHWHRAASSLLAADVRVPFKAGSLVLLLDPAPMAYVAAFSPPGVRFAGIDNNLVHPGAHTALNRAAVAAIAAQRGPLWGLASPADQPGQAERALLAYHLTRNGRCRTIRSNLDADALRACPLRRLSPRLASAARASRTRPAPG